MADPFMKADMVTAMASGQYLFARIQAGDWRDHLQDVALCATTDLNFASQMLLKNGADPAPVPGPVMFAGQPVNVEDVKERLKSYEHIQREMKTATADPVKGPLGALILQFVGPMIDLAVTALKTWLGTLAQPKAI